MKRIVTVDVISSLLILLFAYTGFSKLISIDRFKGVLEQSPLISSGAAILAWQVPLTELCIVLLLFFSVTRLAGLWASIGLLSLFTIYLIYMLLFSVYLPCSCGGVVSQMTWNQHLIFNTVMIGLTVIGIRKQKQATVKNV